MYLFWGSRLAPESVVGSLPAGSGDSVTAGVESGLATCERGQYGPTQPIVGSCALATGEFFLLLCLWATPGSALHSEPTPGVLWQTTWSARSGRTDGRTDPRWAECRANTLSAVLSPLPHEGESRMKSESWRYRHDAGRAAAYLGGGVKPPPCKAHCSLQQVIQGTPFPFWDSDCGNPAHTEMGGRARGRVRDATRRRRHRHRQTHTRTHTQPSPI